MRADFIQYPELKSSEDHLLMIKEPWRKFKHSEVLIRSIYDRDYPDENTLLNNSRTGYYKAEVYDFYHNGLLVWTSPFSQDIVVRRETMDGKTQKEKVRVETLGCIPFENIIDYDLDGDEYYIFPHLFCDFINPTNPYEKIRYIDPDSGYVYKDDDIVTTVVD